LQPRFCRRRLRVAETITKRRGTPFYFSKDTFGSIPISMAHRLKSEACSTKCCRKMVGVIDEKHGV
jgi:hypothetical protein